MASWQCAPVLTPNAAAALTSDTVHWVLTSYVRTPGDRRSQSVLAGGVCTGAHRTVASRSISVSACRHTSKGCTGSLPHLRRDWTRFLRRHLTALQSSSLWKRIWTSLSCTTCRIGCTRTSSRRSCTPTPNSAPPALIPLWPPIRSLALSSSGVWVRRDRMALSRTYRGRARHALDRRWWVSKVTFVPLSTR